MTKKRKKKISMSSLRHVFGTIMWPRRYLLLFGLVLIFFNRLAGLVLPGATKYLFDDIIIPAQNANAVGGQPDMSPLRLLLIVVGIAICVQAITSYTLTRLLSIEAQRLISELRIRIQRHIIHLPVGYFDQNKSGALVSRIMVDVEGVRNLVGTGLVQLCGGILTAVAALAILIYLNAILTCLALVPLLLFAMISAWAFGHLRPIFRRRGELNAEVTGRLTESLGGIRVIKGFNAEEREMKVFARGVDTLFQNVKQTLNATSLVTSLATFLMGLVSVLIMGYGGMKIMEGTMTVGDFFAFTLYLAFLLTPIIQMANIGTQITEAFAGLDRMQEILELERERDNPARTQTLDRAEMEITFESVSFAYENGDEVLTDVSFQARPGSLTALVGTSGSGKTTIAGLAASFLTPDRGCIRVNNIDLATVELDSYRSQLGVVLQDDFLFDGTIRENILFSAPQATEEELQVAVRSAHVAEFTERFADGLGTVIGERGVKLSGGQRQRVAIARAFLANPTVLILDEATSSLDTESEGYIQESLAVLMRGRTTFVIAHRLSTIRQADQILVVEGGKIVERGTHEELIEKNGRYHELYTYQARI